MAGTTVGERLAETRERLVADAMTTEQGLVDALAFVRAAAECPVTEVNAWLNSLTLDEVHGLARIANVTEHITNTFRMFTLMGLKRHGQLEIAVAPPSGVPVS